MTKFEQGESAAMTKERPILFSAPMVRAILEGRKTQTRRIVRRKDGALPLDYHDGMFWFEDGDTSELVNPYGNPGARLWVRETWTHTGTGVWKVADALQASDGKLLYAATDKAPCGGC